MPLPRVVDGGERADGKVAFRMKQAGRGIVTHYYCSHSVPFRPGTHCIRRHSPRTRPRLPAQLSPHFRRGRLPGAEGPPAGSRQGTAGAGLSGVPFGVDRCKSQVAEANRRRRRRVRRACRRVGSSLGSLWSSRMHGERVQDAGPFFVTLILPPDREWLPNEHQTNNEFRRRPVVLARCRPPGSCLPTCANLCQLLTNVTSHHSHTSVAVILIATLQ